MIHVTLPVWMRLKLNNLDFQWLAATLLHPNLIMMFHLRTAMDNVLFCWRSLMHVSCKISLENRGIVKFYSLPMKTTQARIDMEYNTDIQFKLKIFIQNYIISYKTYLIVLFIFHTFWFFIQNMWAGGSGEWTVQVKLMEECWSINRSFPPTISVYGSATITVTRLYANMKYSVITFV